jgi:hypothetical protein
VRSNGRLSKLKITCAFIRTERRTAVSIFSMYQNYETETNRDAYEYEKRVHEEDDRRREKIRRELDRDYFGDREREY